MLAAGAVVQVVLGLPYSKALLVVSAGLLAFASQCVKITVDTLIQREIADAFRGRVFALYDMLFNVALVAAAGLTAALLPEDGHSPAAVVAISVAWAAAAASYLRRSVRTTV